MNKEIKPTMRQIEEGFHSVYVLQNFLSKMKVSIKHSTNYFALIPSLNISIRNRFVVFHFGYLGIELLFQ